MRVLAVALAITALVAGAARADEPATEPAPAPPPRTTHADVADAPGTEQATAIARCEAPEPGGAFRTALRVLFFVPRWTFWAAVQPVRGGLWAWERYQLADRATSIFFNDDETLGAYPLAFVETGFGLNVGGRVVYRDLFGTGGRAKLRASYGGRFLQEYGLSATTGELLGKTAELEIDTRFRMYPKARFFGLGNADLVAREDVTGVVDPQARDLALGTRFRHDDITSQLTFIAHLSRHLSLRAGGGWTQRDFDDDIDEDDDDPFIEDVFDTARLPGYALGLTSLGGELELVYDSRRGSKFWVSDANPNTGWKLAAFLGAQKGIGDDPSRFVRYGADVQRAIDLYDGTRVLYLRAYLEGVTGGVEDVPFVDLPKLGGPVFLRGYLRDRFRDRVSALTSAEYRWTINKMFAAYLFGDVGRVFPRLRDVGFDALRVGYGAGLQLHTATTFRGRFDVSSSIDGGVFFNLGLDPVFDTSSRKESL